MVRHNQTFWHSWTQAKERSTRRGRDTAAEEATLNLTDEQMQEFKAAFNLFAGGGEKLDANQLTVILTKFGMCILMRTRVTLSGIKADAKQMISEADTNKEGSIDFNQFASMMASRMAKVSLTHKQRLRCRKKSRSNCT